MQPYPRFSAHIWPGHLHGTGCLSARDMDTRFRTVLWRMCLGLSFAATTPMLARVRGVCLGVVVLFLGISVVLMFLLFLENPKSQIDKPRRIFRRGTNT